MRSTLIVTLLAAVTLVEAAAHGTPHRRHHAKRASSTKKIGKCRPKATASASSSSTGSTASNGTTVSSSGSTGKNGTSSSSSSSSGNATLSSASSSSAGMSGAQKSNVYLGFLPDEGDAGGSKQTMAQLNALMKDGKAATYGYYAQAQSGTPFDGGQLLAVMDDVKASGAIFEPAVMPTGGWQGLTSSDNSQAVNICNVMKKFTDQGIEVRLRFAHEVNYYQTDGTYTGTAADFKAGWAAVSSACAQIAPNVKMFFTPNIASMDQYQQYYPDDKDSVDYCGIDFYPQSLGATTFVDAMKPFHDFCTANGKTKFAIGETGLGYAGSMSDRLQWLGSMMSVSTKQAMPAFESVSWFNFQKGYDFMILNPSDQSTASALMSFLS